MIVKCVAQNSDFDLTHYMVFANGQTNIYMGTYTVSEPTVGEVSSSEPYHLPGYRSDKKNPTASLYFPPHRLDGDVSGVPGIWGCFGYVWWLGDRRLRCIQR